MNFISTSTADPTCVMLPNRTISTNLDAIVDAAEVVDDDVIVSWLTMYHDMGLVCFCMLPHSHGIDVVIGAPQDFLGAPVRWLECCPRSAAPPLPDPTSHGCSPPVHCATRRTLICRDCDSP